MFRVVNRLLTSLVLFACLVFGGCGGSGNEVQSVPDRSGEISALKKRVKDLEQEIVDEQAVRGRTAEENSGTAISTLLDRLPGQAGLVIGAPGGDGPRLSGGELTSGSAWSTIKVPIAERILADFGGSGGISAAQNEQIRQAITTSDNEAAAALFTDLEAEHGGLDKASEAVGQMLRGAGDDETVISTEGRDGFSTYGQTEWSLAQQNRYMAALAGGCVSDPASSSFLLDQMADVTVESWGLGATGVPAKWKGGWGPGIDGRYLVRQMGVIEASGKAAVVAMAAIADDGSFESAQAMLTEIALWVAQTGIDEVGEPAGCE